MHKVWIKFTPCSASLSHACGFIGLQICKWTLPFRTDAAAARSTKHEGQQTRSDVQVK